jgi:hypothetical protein
MYYRLTYCSDSSILALLFLRDKLLKDNMRSQTEFELHNDGASISGSCWKVTWYEDYVEVVLSGKEQDNEHIILYFDGTRKIHYLTDTKDDYVTRDKLDESRG